MTCAIVAVVGHKGPLLEFDGNVQRLTRGHVLIFRCLSIEVCEAGGGDSSGKRREKKGGNDRCAAGRATQDNFPSVKSGIIHLLASIVAANQPFPSLSASPFGPCLRGIGEVTSGSRLPRLTLRYAASSAPMAKLDKAPAYEAGDCRFESCSERQIRSTGWLCARGPAGEVAERLKALPC